MCCPLIRTAAPRNDGSHGDSRAQSHWERLTEDSLAVLRVDPWDPDYGTSFELERELDDELRQSVELDIESIAWAPVTPSPVEDLPCCAFVAPRAAVRLP